jgi:hypothetical protein
MSCQTRINVGVLLYAFYGLVSQGVASAQLIRYEKTIGKILMLYLLELALLSMPCFLPYSNAYRRMRLCTSYCVF